MKLNAFLQSIESHAAVVTTDEKGSVTYVNEKYCEILGQSRLAVLNSKQQLFTRGLQEESFYDDLWQTIESDQIWEGELCCKREDGTLFWLNCKISPKHDDNGFKEGYFAVGFDITKQKKLEHEVNLLKDLYEEEKKKVLHSSKLSTLGQMSSSLIHEINNPLSVLIGTMKRAKLGESLEEVRNFIERAEIPLNTLNKMVKNLKKYSRNETMIREIKFNDLTEIIKSSMEYTEHKFKDKLVEVRFDIEDSIPFPCEESELEQVFVNLLNNAVDAIEPLKERWVEVFSDEVPGDGVYIFITDSGSGIPKDVAENMFDTFFTTKGKDRGTGIGLSVVRDIIQNHGGNIRVNTDHPNTQFVIHFPYDALKVSA